MTAQVLTQFTPLNFLEFVVLAEEPPASPHNTPLTTSDTKSIKRKWAS